MSKKTNKKLVNDIKKTSKKKIEGKKDTNVFPCGCDMLDLVMGKLQFGKIINIVGDNSTGKTYITIEIIAYLRSILGNKFKWFYDDTEAGFAFNTMSMYGFDILTPDMQSHRSLTVEDLGHRIKKELSVLKKDEFFVYVVDSLDGLSSEDEMKRDEKRYKAIESNTKFDSGSYGMGKAKYLSEFFRLRAKEIENKKCLLIVISQVRENIGVTFGAKYRRHGGKALDHYSSSIVWLAVAEKHKKKGRTVGVTVKAKTTKARNDKPYREGYIDLIFDYGIDNIITNINFLYDLKSKSGEDVDNADKKKLKWNGRDYTRKLLIKSIETKNLEKELSEKTIKLWNEIEDSISSKNRKKKWVI